MERFLLLIQVFVLGALRDILSLSPKKNFDKRPEKNESFYPKGHKSLLAAHSGRGAAITLCFVGLFMLTAFDSKAQNGIRWMTWQQAIQAVNADKVAGRTPKVVMVDVYTNWCTWCKKLEANFGIGYIANFVNQHFYPVKFDAESQEAITFKGYKFGNVPTGNGKRGIHQLAYSLLDGDMGYPTVVFLNEELNIMQRIRSSMDEKTLYTVLNYMVSDDYGTLAYPEFEKKFNKNKKLTGYEPAQPAPSYQPQTLVPPRK